MAVANGSFTASSSWALCDSTAELDSEAANTALTTSYVTSQTFTPGAITIDGIAVKVSSRNASPSGTISIALDQGGSDVSGTVVTINVSDINVNGNGWYLFKFSSPVTLAAATAYSVKAKTSVSSQVNLFRNSTAGNWSRQLRTTTTQAPAASDTTHVCGEHTGAGAVTTRTITVDHNSSTTYGLHTVNSSGTTRFGTSASSTYLWRVASGGIKVYGGGTFSVGETAVPMPSTSTATLEFNCAATVDSGLEVLGGTFNAGGATKTTLKTTLTADVAASGSVLTVGSTSGWLASDQLAVASTTTTTGQSEKVTVQSVDSGTQVTLTGSIVNAHSGTSPTQAEVGNLTRNVKIRGVSTSLQGYLRFSATAVVDINYSEIYNMGSATSLKRGIDIQTTTGTVLIRNSGFYDFTTSAILFDLTGSSVNNVTIENNIAFNINRNFVYCAATSGTSITVNNNLFILSSGTNFSIIELDDVGITVTNNTCVSSTGTGSYGIHLSEDANLGTFSGNTIHSCGGSGIAFDGNIKVGTLSTTTTWRNVTGLSIESAIESDGLIIDTVTAFGNTTANIKIDASVNGLLIFKSLTLNAGTTSVAPIGIRIGVPTVTSYFNVDRIHIYSSSFGATTTHSTGDIHFEQYGNHRVECFNCNFASSTEVSTQTNLGLHGYVSSNKHDQTTSTHKIWKRAGTLTTDTTIYSAASPSLRMTPTSSTEKLKGGVITVPVSNGAAVSLSAKVRESVSGDGTDYNGNRIRLMAEANPAIGINSDTVIATATAGSEGSFQLISGNSPTPNDNGILKCYFDCDGTTGWVNIDDVDITTSTPDSKGFGHWLGEPQIMSGQSQQIIINQMRLVR